MTPWRLDVCGAREALEAGELSAAELTASCVERIEELEPAIQAWETLEPERALAAAEEPVEGPLGGIPCGIKDIFNTTDMPTRMGSPAWQNFTPGNDARVVAYAKWAGTIVVGKTVTAEFAVHAPGKTRNPHDPRYSPGTSSSGSAAAVASGMVPWALGSQTAGSIIRPASYCGVYGYKPSYGTLPRTGMLKTTDTLDQIGYFTRSIRDLYPLLEVLRVRGSDYPLVHETLDRPKASGLGGRELRFALVTDSLDVWGSAVPEARDALADYARRLEDAGVRVEPVAVPDSFNDAHRTHGTIYDRSIAYYFDRESREGQLVSDKITSMAERGRKISLAEYTAALDRQVEIQRDFAEFIKGFDALLTLSTAAPAPLFGEDDIIDSALIWTLCGAPAISLPVFRSANGLPFGAQLVGSRFGDHELLAALRHLDAIGLSPDVAAQLGDAMDERVPVQGA
jgi:Asp-tRNA(Asn)/Glu-tRNA(Gln) amidotransferase A subunit family amidase